MVVRIDDFLSEVSKGGGMAMGNMFKVRLPNLNGDARAMSLLCTSVTLPGRQMLSAEKRTGMDLEKIAYGYATEDVTMSFYILNDYRSKLYFETWQNLVVNQNTKEVGYHQDYTFDVEIQQLRKGVGFNIKKKKLFDAGKIPSSIRGRLPRLGPLDFAQGQFDLNLITPDDVIYKCKLIDAYPTSLTAVELSAESNVIQVSVQLSYKNWSSEDGGGVGSQLVQGLLGGLLRKIL